jgi:hypothetical protein
MSAVMAAVERNIEMFADFFLDRAIDFFVSIASG